MADDKAFLEFIVKSLVDFPDDVRINRTVDEMGVLITMTVNGADMGKIIGRQGNTAKAIRTLLRVVGMKNNARVNLKINEPEIGAEARSTPQVSTTTESEASNVASYVHTSEAKATQASKSVDDALNDLKGI